MSIFKSMLGKIIFKNIKKKLDNLTISEEDITETLKQIRIELLNADVNILVIKMEIQPEMIIRSKNIICPECNKEIKMKINNRYNIDLYGCINNHKFNNISFDEFKKTQMINISKTILLKLVV